MNWWKLESFIKDNLNQKKVSISGGGDPLDDFYNRGNWWDRMFEITDKYMDMDIHTRIKLLDKKFWHKINRCVFSVDFLQDDEDYLNWLSRHTKLRITHLVTASTTFQMIEDFLEFTEKSETRQFTIKELVGFSDNGMYQKIKEKYPEVFSLDYGDYNIYYMPDNNIYDKFLI
jgi:hypothetical protein